MSSKERSGEASRAENLDADLRLVLLSELSMFFSTSKMSSRKSWAMAAIAETLNLSLLPRLICWSMDNLDFWFLELECLGHSCLDIEEFDRPEDFVVLHGPALHIRAEAGEITSR